MHQFEKVEQYIICRADHEESVRWHEELLANSEEMVQALELPYRVVNICTGDLGDAKVKGYDIETWMPSEGRYRETHSDSYFHDYQARRADLRYRGDDGVVRFVHTLNNTALASARTIIDAGREPSAGGRDDPCARGAAPLPRRTRGVGYARSGSRAGHFCATTPNASGRRVTRVKLADCRRRITPAVVRRPDALCGSPM